MNTQRIFVDSNVLASRAQRDWLFLLREQTGGGMFRIYLTEDVIAETIRAIRKRNPKLDGQNIDILSKKLRDSADNLVANFDGKIHFPGKDKDDTHIHAASIACRAHMLLTNDNGFFDLGATGNDQLEYEPIKADDFFILIDDSVAAFTKEVTTKQVEYWKKHNKGESTIVQALQEAGCPKFAERIKQHLAVLSGPPGRDKYRANLAPH